MYPRQQQAAIVVTPVLDQKGRVVLDGETFGFVGMPRVPVPKRWDAEISATDTCTAHICRRMYFNVPGVGEYRFYLPSEVLAMSVNKQGEYLMDTLCAAYKRLGHLERKYRDILELDGEL